MTNNTGTVVTDETTKSSVPLQAHNDSAVMFAKDRAIQFCTEEQWAQYAGMSPADIAAGPLTRVKVADDARAEAIMALAFIAARVFMEDTKNYRKGNGAMHATQLGNALGATNRTLITEITRGAKALIDGQHSLYGEPTREAIQAATGHREAQLKARREAEAAKKQKLSTVDKNETANTDQGNHDTAEHNGNSLLNDTAQLMHLIESNLDKLDEDQKASIAALLSDTTEKLMD